MNLGWAMQPWPRRSPLPGALVDVATLRGPPSVDRAQVFQPVVIAVLDVVHLIRTGLPAHVTHIAVAREHRGPDLAVPVRWQPLAAGTSLPRRATLRSGHCPSRPSIRTPARRAGLGPWRRGPVGVEVERGKSSCRKQQGPVPVAPTWHHAQGEYHSVRCVALIAAAIWALVATGCSDDSAAAVGGSTSSAATAIDAPSATLPAMVYAGP
jgi:hypothetical protein